MKSALFKAIIDEQIFSFEKKEALELDVIQIDDRKYHLVYHGQSYSIEIVELDLSSQSVYLIVDRHPIEIYIQDERMELIKELGFDLEAKKKVDEILAPMPGLVVDVMVKVGDQVKEGDPILILEAMKMENIINAPADALIEEIFISKEDKVEKSEKLVQLK